MTDRRLRTLERTASTGDLEAQVDLWQLQLRLGLLHEEYQLPVDLCRVRGSVSEDAVTLVRWMIKGDLQHGSWCKFLDPHADRGSALWRHGRGFRGRVDRGEWWTIQYWYGGFNLKDKETPGWLNQFVILPAGIDRHGSRRGHDKYVSREYTDKFSNDPERGFRLLARYMVEAQPPRLVAQLISLNKQLKDARHKLKSYQEASSSNTRWKQEDRLRERVTKLTYECAQLRKALGR